MKKKDVRLYRKERCPFRTQKKYTLVIRKGHKTTYINILTVIEP